MSDQSFREIQLSGKQLVFLFMASVVLAVGVFLLGVSVGRGVRGAAGPAESTVADATPAPQAAPVEMPPPVRPEAQDLGYHDMLQGQAASGAQTSAAQPDLSVSPPPSAEPTPVDEPQPAAPAPKPTAKPVTPPAKPAAPSVATAKAAAPPAPGQGWAVQVNAFKSRENADRQAAQLKASGMPAFVVATAQNTLFQVRVGPYAQRADAERTAVRIRQQGISKAPVNRY